MKMGIVGKIEVLNDGENIRQCEGDSVESNSEATARIGTTRNHRGRTWASAASASSVASTATPPR
jgi:hypothetical protein